MAALLSVDAQIVGGPAKSIAALFDYLRPGGKTDEATDSEPPRKRRRRSGKQSSIRDGAVEENAILIASREVSLRFSSARHGTYTGEPVVLKISSTSTDEDGDIRLSIRPTHAFRVKVEHAELALHSSFAEYLPFLQELDSIPPSEAAGDAPVWSKCALQTSKDGRQILLSMNILCTANRSWQGVRHEQQIEALISKYLSLPDMSGSTTWTPQDFYQNVHVPRPDAEIPPYLEKPNLLCQLYPFQKRAVQWMVDREGATWDNNALNAKPTVQSLSDELPPAFQAVKDASGQECYISQVHKVMLKDKWSLSDYQPELNGGILAEEMGLGKTVELLALVALHRQPPHLAGRIVNDLAQSGATLIITPSHIIHQWQKEIESHAPHLKVLYYKGVAGSDAKRGFGHTIDVLLDYDIVLTTYNILAREIYYAEDPPDRSRRHARKYERPRSPLVKINWWRVCLDEAQMIESGVSNAARVARRIPRINAWAVSGTPLKKNIEDLHGLLIFLDYQPFASSKKAWNSVDLATLKQIFGTIALRHNKHMIASELSLPRQRRIAITMPFTAIEEQNYETLYKKMCKELDLKDDGSPAVDDWSPENYYERMRQWLRRLRETCLHPNVGSQNRRALGRGHAPLRTVQEVLETMIEQNRTELRAQERTMVVAQIKRGQIINNDKANSRRSEDALVIYLEALKKIEVIVQDCREDLDVEVARIKAEKAANKDGKAYDSDSDSDSEDEKGSTKKTRLAGFRKQLRSALEVYHLALFFVGTAYYQMKEKEKAEKDTEDTDEFRRLEQLEVEWYDRAKAVRKELLGPAREAATAAMAKLQDLPASSTIPEPCALENRSGIENQKLCEKFDDIVETLSAQKSLTVQWRDKILETLLRPLVDTEGDKEITGDEYEDSTTEADNLYVYVMGLRAMIADRYQCVAGEKNLLMTGEFKHAKKVANEGKGHAPALMLSIVEQRKKIMPKEALSMQGVLAEARSLVGELRTRNSARADAEATIVAAHMHDLRDAIAPQREIVKNLEKEQVLIHAAMNSRVEFYRQLQEISDLVAPWKEELDETLDEPALSKQRGIEIDCEADLAHLTTKRRFFQHLREESGQQQGSRLCVICREDSWESGVLTVCGHVYCKACALMWFRSHRTCPECRRILNPVRDVHDITYRPQEMRALEETNDKSDSEGASPSSSRESPTTARSSGSLYTQMDAATMEEIKKIDLDGSFGTKIDAICRHLIWLREKGDPGAQSIIFSAHSDFLTVLYSAMKHFKISCVSIRDAQGVEKFRRDRSRECLLLDAHSNSSGLNLVNATHVFLCEPLVNAAIELQAIARVHRIGQLRETTVYAYLISDTVEEAIYDISVARRLAHIGKASSATASRDISRAQTPAAIQESALDKANTLEIQQAPISTVLSKGRREGEWVPQDDLWGCLFGKPRKAGDGVSNALRREVDREVRAVAAEDRMQTSP